MGKYNPPQKTGINSQDEICTVGLESNQWKLELVKASVKDLFHQMTLIKYLMSIEHIEHIEIFFNWRIWIC